MMLDISKVRRADFKRGAQSRQAEIDELQAMYEKQGLYAFELQKRIDEIENHVDLNYDSERNYDHHPYSSGYKQAMYELDNILKGNQNET